MAASNSLNKEISISATQDGRDAQMPLRLFVNHVLMWGTVLARVPQIGERYVVRLCVAADKEPLEYVQ